MSPSKTVKQFNDKYPLIGPTLWVLSIQYFVIQFIAIKRFKFHYSILHNTISDLGNTACAQYDLRSVCSPDHSLMNASLILLGAFMTGGALLIYQEFKKERFTIAGFWFMALSGIGTILVGIFPENSISILHEIGAGLPFILGNIGVLILGLKLDIPKKLKTYSVITGIVALIGIVLFITKSYLGLGIGGMERIAAYPQTIWLIVFGIYMSKNRYIKIKKSK